MGERVQGYRGFQVGPDQASQADTHRLGHDRPNEFGTSEDYKGETGVRTRIGYVSQIALRACELLLNLIIQRTCNSLRNLLLLVLGKRVEN